MFSKWNISQRKGVVLLLMCVLVVQVVFFCIDFQEKKITLKSDDFILLNEKIDSLIQKQQKQQHFAFNPNFLSDYAAQRWGMSADAFNRLNEYRSQGKFVNSPEEFQQVTQISDSLFSAMKDYLKFPEWINKKTTQKQKYYTQNKKEHRVIQKKDINTASLEDFQELRGIGEVISQRIINYRKKLGGFSLMEQVSDVWGLSPEVIDELNKYFTINNIPDIERLNLNIATKYELMRVPYLDRNKVEQIILYRSKEGSFTSLEQILQVPDLEKENLRKLSIYLSVE